MNEPALCPKHNTDVDEYGCAACEAEGNDRREVIRLAELAWPTLLKLEAGEGPLIEVEAKRASAAAFMAAKIFLADRQRLAAGQ